MNSHGLQFGNHLVSAARADRRLDVQVRFNVVKTYVIYVTLGNDVC